MQTYVTISSLGIVGGLLFFFALGAICGSFINVLVYRLPKGLNIVTPPSACPHCGTRLTWRQNFPIFGWLWLRGRCRFCRSPVSVEYPLVELFVAVLFATYFLWFADPYVMDKIGVNIRAWRPEWAADGLWRMWPMLLIILCLSGSFVAATLIDAKTFLIPIALPWFATVVAFVVHPLHALWMQLTRGGLFDTHFAWTIPTPTGLWLGAALGGALGVALSAALLAMRVLPRSFADYEAWEDEHHAQQAARVERAAEPKPDEGPRDSLRLALRRTLYLTGPAVTLMFVGFTIGLRTGWAFQGLAIGLGLGLIIGLALRRLAEPAPDDEPDFLQYPYARREMGKELLYLAPIFAGALLGAWLCSPGRALEPLALDAPLWLRALAGSLLGYLVAGGAVWLVRIGGSLAVNTEAMGIGDVHLLAAAGAALGWIDPLLAFFTAPFFGIAWVLLGVVFKRLFRATGAALPYGPHLAAATLVVLLCKPLYEQLVSWILGEPINIP